MIPLADIENSFHLQFVATSTTAVVPRSLRFDPANVRVALFVAASVLTHLVLTQLLPHYVAPEPLPPAPVDFAVLVSEPEPEPIVEEPEAEVLDEPEPVVRETRIVEPDEVPDVDVQHEVEETTEAEPVSEHAADTSEPIAGTVNSTEGGLNVARQAGSGRDGGALGREPIVAPAPAPRRVGIDRRRIVRDYLRQVQRALGAPRFTRALQRADVEGVVMVGLRIDPAGHVHAVRIKESSGHSLVDDAALAHVQRTENVPAPPDVLDWVTREITLPVRYIRRAQR